ncbi:MAG: phytanoyl-CoA dioxygenase family protein [Chloracidobacterium sp.]|nr:phytanoyl-CoA dioxygenase family protein [Chloracidobacterium sp.]
MQANDLKEQFDTKGFLVIPDVLDHETVAELKETLSRVSLNASVKHRKGSVFGVRNLLGLVPELAKFVKGEIIQNLATTLLGDEPKIARSIYFDKTANANWKVPWHQDLTIAVKDKREVPGFGPWTKKANVWHVQPSIDFLHPMVTLRFHLDDTDETNGALKVIPGSQTKGRLSAKEIQAIRKGNEFVICSVKSGDCLAMHPLLLHSSTVSLQPRHRRIIHLEFSSAKLPDGLEWYEI